MRGRQVAAYGKRERIHAGVENCYISLKKIEGRDGDEATQEEKDVHHRGWGRLGKTCPERQSSCSTWPFVQVIIGTSSQPRDENVPVSAG